MKRVRSVAGIGLLLSLVTVLALLALRWGFSAEPADQELSSGTHVVVRYARSQAELAAKVGEETAKLVEANRTWGRVTEADRLTVLVETKPAKGAAGTSARAVAPFQVAVVTGKNAKIDEPGRPAGLEAAVALALTQPADSPAFTVDWLHVGMGALLAEGFNVFPDHLRGVNPADMLAALDKPGTSQYQTAAESLAGLVMDRWGIDWTAHYKRKPEELTPRAMLLWTSGGRTEAEALAYWKERLSFVYGWGRRQFKLGTDTWVSTAADLSPVRLSPTVSQLPKGPGPNENYSPHQYKLDVRWEPEHRLIKGDMTLTWENGEGIPVDTLYFNLWPNAEQFAMYGGRMTVQSVQVDGQAAAYVAQALDLTVPLGRAVAPGERATVAIRFTTKLPGIITDKGLGQLESRRFVLTHWYPTLAVLDERGWNLFGFATKVAETYSENTHFTVRLDLPAKTVIGATGRVTKKDLGEERWVYEYDAPNVKDWVAVGGTDLVERVSTLSGIKFHLIDSSSQWMDMATKVTHQAVLHFTERFGPYPYQDLVISSVSSAGMEWPGFFFTRATLATSQEYNQFYYTTIHEAAHQWFYGIVGNDQYHDVWLDEGFATYADRSATREAWRIEVPDVSLRKDLGKLSATASQYDLLQDGHSSVPYQRGAQVLEDLEKRIGRPTMDRLMQEWVRRFAHKTATTRDFVALANEITGTDLTAFFGSHDVSTEREVYRPLLPLGQATYKK
ncbi:MAG: hypothetical protein K0R39_2201 [Symbiobacteriaceae bacterium]|jgi:hypothetical protein|nr:hypothetical protein [Symbiobacteriaceae bacterium]